LPHGYQQQLDLVLVESEGGGHGLEDEVEPAAERARRFHQQDPLAIVPTASGSISVFPSNPTHVIMDISGYFGQ
jgi:hypothetical protein